MVMKPYIFDVTYNLVGEVMQRLCDLSNPGDLITLDPVGPAGGNPSVVMVLNKPNDKIDAYLAHNDFTPYAIVVD